MNPSSVIYALHVFDLMGNRPPRQSLRELREVLDDGLFFRPGIKCRAYTADDHRAYRKRAARRHRRKWLAKRQRKHLAGR